MEELSTMMSLLRNISSAARLVENYIIKDSTYNPGEEGLEKFKHALDHISSIEKDVRKITDLNLQLQRKAQPR